MKLKFTNGEFEFKAGDHFWLFDDEDETLIMCCLFENGQVHVCGDWEYGINEKKLIFLEKVPVPKGYENNKPFYI